MIFSRAPLPVSQPSITASLEEFAKSRPELYKDVIAKIKEADAPGVRATVAEPKGAQPDALNALQPHSPSRVKP